MSAVTGNLVAAVIVATCANHRSRRVGTWLSLSAWLSRAAERALMVERGLEAVRAWERDHGSLTDSELADADKVLNRILARRTRRAS